MRLLLAGVVALASFQEPPIKPPKDNPIPAPDYAAPGRGATHSCWSADSKQLAMAPVGGAIAVFALSEGHFKSRTFGDLGKEFVSGMAFSGDGKTLVVAQAVPQELRFWDVETGVEQPAVKLPAVIRRVAWSPEGSHLAAALADATVRLYEAGSRKEVKSIKFKNNVSSLAFSPDGKTLLTGGHNPVSAWSVPGGSLVREFGVHRTDKDSKDVAREVVCIRYSPDGKKVVTGGSDNRIRVWDATTGRSKAVAFFAWISTTHAGWLPDGRHLLCGGTSSGLHVIDSATGKERAGFRTEGGVAPLSSPDGEHVLMLGGFYKAATLMKELGEAGPEPAAKEPPEPKAEEEKPVALVDNPEYKGWSKCRVGSMIRYRITTTMSTSEATFKLMEISADKAEIEQVFVTDAGGARQTTTLPKSIPAKVAKGESAEGKRLEVEKEPRASTSWGRR